MLFDKIVDRKLGCSYSANELYYYLVDKNYTEDNLEKNVIRGMKFSDEEAVKKALVEYLECCGCSNELVAYVNTVNWVKYQRRDFRAVGY